VVIERSETVYDDRDDGPPQAYGEAPAYQGDAPPACGSWSWDGANRQYHWTPCSPSSPPASSSPYPPPSAYPSPSQSPSPSPSWRPTPETR
jgi:hypothetical protein